LIPFSSFITFYSFSFLSFCFFPSVSSFLSSSHHILSYLIFFSFLFFSSLLFSSLLFSSPLSLLSPLYSISFLLIFILLSSPHLSTFAFFVVFSLFCFRLSLFFFLSLSLSLSLPSILSEELVKILNPVFLFHNFYLITFQVSSPES